MSSYQICYIPNWIGVSRLEAAPSPPQACQPLFRFPPYTPPSEFSTG